MTNTEPTDALSLANAAAWMLKELEERELITPALMPAYTALRKAWSVANTYTNSPVSIHIAASLKPYNG